MKYLKLFKESNTHEFIEEINDIFVSEVSDDFTIKRVDSLDFVLLETSPHIIQYNITLYDDLHKEHGIGGYQGNTQDFVVRVSTKLFDSGQDLVKLLNSFAERVISFGYKTCSKSSSGPGFSRRTMTFTYAFYK